MRRISCVLGQSEPRATIAPSEMLLLHKLHWVMKCIFPTNVEKSWKMRKTKQSKKLKCNDFFISLLSVNVPKL